MAPVIDVLVWPFALLSWIVWGVGRNSSAAIILSAISAAVFASLAMGRQARTARLKETFAILNRDNWSQDVKNARQIVRRITNEIGENRGAISRYAADARSYLAQSQIIQTQAGSSHAAPPVAADDEKSTVRAIGTNEAVGETAEEKFISDKITLLTMLNDYESLALGIKHGILDELFLFEFMRSTALYEWDVLSPLVYEYRQREKNVKYYSEFEGLVGSWRHGRSYQNNRRLEKRRSKFSWLHPTSWFR